MKFCKHCGFPIPEGSRFCPGCGIQLSDDDLQKAPRPEDASAFDPSENPEFWAELSADLNSDLQETQESSSNKEEKVPSSNPYWLPAQTDVMKTEKTDSKQDSSDQPVSPASSEPSVPAEEEENEDAQEEEKTEELDQKGIRGLIHRYKNTPEDLEENEDEDEEEIYYSDPGGFRGGLLIGAGLCTALLVCLGLAFLNGWIRLPSKIEDEKQTEIAEVTDSQTEEPEDETVEDSADSFKKAFTKNNTTVPEEDEDDNKNSADQKTQEGDSWTPYGSMNVRAKPDASSRKTGTIPAGEPVQILETVTGPGGALWGKIGADKYVCLQDGDTHFLVPSDEFIPIQSEPEDEDSDQEEDENESRPADNNRDNTSTRRPGRNDD